MASDEVIVAVALGLPSLIVAVLALWVAYLTFRNARPTPAHIRPYGPDYIPWNMALPPAPAGGYELLAFRRRL